MRIGIVGAGYVGLVTGVCLAEMGNDVLVADIDPAKIAALRAGRSPHFEPGLDEMIAGNRNAGRLRFGESAEAAASDAEIVFFAVGTPQDEVGAANLTHLENAVRQVAGALTSPCVLVIKSTVPVGTNRRMAKLARGLSPHPVETVSNPEFLKEGAAVSDFMRPDRVVIGGDSSAAIDTMRALYAPFVRTGAPLMAMDPESAEMVKYVSNTLLAARISLMNEMANICLATGADIDQVRLGAGADRRIGPTFLFAGLGYGGSCFPKDVRALAHVAESNGARADICRAVDAVNVRQAGYFLPAVEAEWGTDWTGRRAAFWGLAFKPSTDDVRESPALHLARRLLARGVRLAAHDPVAMAGARRELGVDATVEYFDNPYDALPDADALFVCTEWNAFRSPDFGRIKNSLKEPLVFDGRNLYDPRRMREAGFRHHAVGRPGAGPITDNRNS